MLISPLLLSKEKCKAKSQSRLLRWPFVNNEKKINQKQTKQVRIYLFQILMKKSKKNVNKPTTYQCYVKRSDKTMCKLRSLVDEIESITKVQY